MATLHVWPQEVEVVDGCVSLSAKVEDREPFTLQMRVPIEHAHLLSHRAEPFVAMTVMLAMLRGATLRVHGTLSPSFLRNLEELQAIWPCWNSQFQRVAIEADEEREVESVSPHRAVSLFSGGVDSCFTVWRHTQNLCGRRALPLQTAVMVHGSEILLSQGEVFERALARSRRMLDGVNVQLVRLSSNYRAVMPGLTGVSYANVWFAGALSACLLLFQESHSTGLIPASFSYHGLVMPYGSTPLTDPLYGTAKFPIEYDGGGSSRAEKLREIIAWPEVLSNLRVCNQPFQQDRNCGKCEKCVRNILTLRILGIENPPCFPGTLTNADIRRIRMHPTEMNVMRRVLLAADEAGVRASWVSAVHTALRRNARHNRWEAARQTLKGRLPAPVVAGVQLLTHSARTVKKAYVPAITSKLRGDI